jgi:hypothetical protein
VSILDWVLAAFEDKRWRRALIAQAIAALLLTVALMAVALLRRGGASLEGVVAAGVTVYILMFAISVVFTARAVPPPHRAPKASPQRAARRRKERLSAATQLAIAMISCAASVGFWWTIYRRPGEMIVTALGLFLFGRWAWTARNRGHRKRSD